MPRSRARGKRDGGEYITITTGGGNPCDATVSLLRPDLEAGKSGTMLWVFKMGGLRRGLKRGSLKLRTIETILAFIKCRHHPR
jgi:hypothetical protein